MTTPRKPNIILVLTDDQGTGDLACTGNPWIDTPNIDAFHEQSIRFTNYHVGPTCAPTRAGLISGHHANSTGVWHTVGGRSLLRGNEVSLADVFQEQGYATGLFGKWHLGDNYPYRPQDRGFQECIVHGGGGISQMPDYWLNDYFDDTYMVNGVPKKFEGYCTDVWFRESLSFIERHKDDPFLCFITPNAPHSPYLVEKKYSDPYQSKVFSDTCAKFYGMITNIDENFGQLEQKLIELGIEKDTIVIFMTDNGGTGGLQLDQEQYVQEGFNAGLRGGKGSSYDGGHRVPFFIRWPNADWIEPQDIETLTSFVDFMPTMMDLCGIDLQNYAHLNFHGRSLKPLLNTNSCEWEPRAITTDSQRLVHPIKWRNSAVMTQDYRLINGRELYHINSDREQRHDIAAQHPDIVTELRREYEVWWDLVSQDIDDDIPISIGHPNESETCLRAHDWRHPDNPKYSDPNVVEDNRHLVFNQGEVRQGMGQTGYFEIMVETAGLYNFELRRWPKEDSRPIVDGIEESTQGWRSDIITKAEDISWYSGGKAMPFKKARFSIGDHSDEKDISPEDHSVSFTADLKLGPIHMNTLFSDEQGLERGAYYVYVTLLEEQS